MLHAIPTDLISIAFLCAGGVNLAARPGMQDQFARWGYPRWWPRLTGVIEIACAALIAFAPTRGLGLVLGAAVLSAALLTVLRHRDYSHLPPIGAFGTLLGLAAAVQ